MKILQIEETSNQPGFDTYTIRVAVSQQEKWAIDKALVDDKDIRMECDGVFLEPFKPHQFVMPDKPKKKKSKKKRLKQVYKLVETLAETIEEIALIDLVEIRDELSKLDKA